MGLASADDLAVLEWAANHQRLVVTNDAATMIRFAKERVVRGLSMPGLIEARRHLSVRVAIEDLYTIALCSEPGEWEGQVVYLPL